MVIFGYNHFELKRKWLLLSRVHIRKGKPGEIRGRKVIGSKVGFFC